MARKLTSEEKKWLSIGLNTLKSGEYRGGGHWINIKTSKIKEKDNPIDPGFFLKQIDNLKVIATKKSKDFKLIINFAVDKSQAGNNNCLVNYSIEYRPKLWRNLLIFVEDKAGQLTSMEIV